LPFFWERTSIIGEERSVGIWVLSTLAGAVGSLSTLVMIPFASWYGPIYTSAITTGMASSGLVASILSLIQAPEIEPSLLSVKHYFLVTLGITLLSFISAFVISFVPRVTLDIDETKTIIEDSDGVQRMLLPVKETSFSFCALVQELLSPVLNQCYISIMAYTILGLLPYLVVGFEQQARNTIVFWLTLTGVFFGALGRALTAKFYFYNLRVTTILQVGLWSYLIIMVFVQQSSSVHVAWGWLSVCCNALHAFVYGFADTTNYHKVAYHLPADPNLIEKGSRIVGVSNQVGALIGSLTSFMLALYGLPKTQ